jgi:hypothetical protein
MKKTNFRNLKVGEKLSETQYYSVVKIAGEKVQLKNEANQDIVVDKNYVEDCLISGNQFTEEQKMSKTDLAKMFLENPNVVFTVSFNKQVKETDVVKEIMDSYEGSTPKTIEAAIKKAVKRGLTGEERVLTGYHTGTQDDFGRVTSVDMNITKEAGKDYNTSLRLVDPRNLNYLILKGTKYTVK